MGHIQSHPILTFRLVNSGSLRVGRAGGRGGDWVRAVVFVGGGCLCLIAWVAGGGVVFVRVWVAGGKVLTKESGERTVEH